MPARAKGRRPPVREQPNGILSGCFKDRICRYRFRLRMCSMPQLMSPLRKSQPFMSVRQSWVQFLLRECPDLLGGSPGECYSNFECFWKLYKMEHPTHAIFSTHAQRLDSVVPLCIHGDEGRGLKKSNYLVMSMQSPLGSTPRPSKRKCNCEASLRHREDLPFADGQDPSLSRTVKEFMDSVWCNFRGHS